MDGRGDYVKCLVKDKVESIHTSPLIQVVSSQRAIRLVKHNLALVYSSWVFPATFLSFMHLETTSAKSCCVISLETEVRMTVV